MCEEVAAQMLLYMCLRSGRAGSNSNNTNHLENTQQKRIILASSARGEQAHRGRPQEAEGLRDEVRHAFSGLVGAQHEFGARWCYTDDAADLSLW